VEAFRSVQESMRQNRTLCSVDVRARAIVLYKQRLVNMKTATTDSSPVENQFENALALVNNIVVLYLLLGDVEGSQAFLEGELVHVEYLGSGGQQQPQQAQPIETNFRLASFRASLGRLMVTLMLILNLVSKSSL
jgi:hypothetical protein